MPGIIGSVNNKHCMPSHQDKNAVYVSTKLRAKDLITFSFYVLYRKPMIVILSGFSIYMLVMLPWTLNSNNETPWFALVFVPFVLIGLPLFTYLSANKRFNTDGRVSEQIEYQFDEDEIQMKGESFRNAFNWQKLYKVSETRKWILLWHNANSANIIPKRDIPKDSLIRLRDLIDSAR